MHRRCARLLLIASLAALAAPTSQATAGQPPVRRSGPLLNEAAPFNQPPGPGPRVTAARVVSATPTRAPLYGSLINEAAPFNSPPGGRG